jgi:DNA-binding CsgD family transcriptional regulator
MSRALRLSVREREVVLLVAGGCSDKEIAQRMGLSLGTVKTYLGRVYRRNELKNRAHAVAVFSVVNDVAAS